MSRRSILHIFRSIRSFNTNVPVMVESHSGARVLNLNRSSSGNILDKSVTSSLIEKLKSYEDNDVVGLVVFSSDSKDLFSHGGQKQTVDDLKSMNLFSKRLSEFNKGTAVVYEGQVFGSGLSTFMGSKVRPVI